MYARFRGALLAIGVLASSAAIPHEAKAYTVFSSNDPDSGLDVGAVKGLALNADLSSFSLLNNQDCISRQCAYTTSPESYLSYGGYNVSVGADVHEIAANGLSSGSSIYTTAPISVDLRYIVKTSDVGAGQLMSFMLADTFYSSLGSADVGFYINGVLFSSATLSGATDTATVATASDFVVAGDQIDTVFSVHVAPDGSYTGANGAGTLVVYQGTLPDPVPEPSSAALAVPAAIMAFGLSRLRKRTMAKGPTLG